MNRKKGSFFVNLFGVRRIQDFDEEELDNMEWAFARAGQKRVVKILQQRKKANGVGATLVAGPAVAVPKCGQIVVAGGGIGGAAVAVALQSN